MHIFFNDVPRFTHFLGGEISTLILGGEDAKLCLNTLWKAKTVPLPGEHTTKLWSIPRAGQGSPGALKRLGSCADPTFCLEPQAARQRLQVLRKQECAAFCLAGSWLLTATGSESSLSASTLILINRSTATVPPCSSPEHSQPLLCCCSSSTVVPNMGKKSKSCTQTEGLHWLQPSWGPAEPRERLKHIQPQMGPGPGASPPSQSTDPGLGCDVAPTVPELSHVLCPGADLREEGFPQVCTFLKRRIFSK